MSNLMAAVRSWIFGNASPKEIIIIGLGSGLLCLPTNLISRLTCTACCPYRGLLGGLPLLFLPFLAALIVALFVDWSDVPPERSIRVGVDVGLRTGVLSAGSGFVVTVVTELAALSYAQAKMGLATDPWGAVMRQTALGALRDVATYTIIIAAIFALFGIGTAILGASLVAAVKRSARRNGSRP